MPVEIKWIHHASFRIAGGGGVLYIDPWKLAGAAHDADVIFVSHDHYDHCSPEDVKKVSRDDTAIVAPLDTIARLGAANAIAPGESITVKGVTIEAVAAYNVDKAFHPKANNWCGAVFTLDGKRLYYAGDTDLIAEMSALSDVDVAMFPVGGTYTLDAAGAAKAAQAVGCRAAIPYHWGDIVGTRADAEKFAKLAPCKVHVLKAGESISV